MIDAGRKIANMDGHVKDALIRSWVFDGGDAGAMNLPKRFEGGFEDIFFVPDIGHYMMAATKAMLKVSRHVRR